ncbi:uncharacterized protein LOC134247137 [Saccostrea cucullata]|uniref:uncharacterized protein LOC134247137 n=1 Tax=Saccostrea cuccullata TaxID=36930 RepID=UPI002ED55A40
MQLAFVLYLCFRTVEGIIRQQIFIRSEEDIFTECSDSFPAFSAQHCLLECLSVVEYPGPRIWKKELKTCICCGSAFPGYKVNLTSFPVNGVIGYTPRPEPCIKNYRLFFIGSEVACLRYEINTVTYPAALSSCQSDGGNLIKINSQSKNELIIQFIDLYGNNAQDIWLQGRLFNSSCIWVFEDNTVITFNFWNNSVPKCDLTQPHIRARADRGFLWFDRISSDPFAYICEMDPSF